VTPVRPAGEIDRGEKPFIQAWGEQSAPAWSPDGRKIAFIINNGAPDYRELATVNADGTALTVILERVGSQEHPSWAPDGGRIVFVDFGVNKWGWLFTVKPDGTGLTQLEDPLDVGSYYSPMWSR